MNFSGEVVMGIGEGRREQRKQLYYYIDILDAVKKESVGRVVDITTGGLKVITDIKKDMGLVEDLIIRVSEIYDETQDIDVKAKTVWSSKDINVDYFVTGYEFTKISPSSQKRIRNLINRCSFVD